MSASASVKQAVGEAKCGRPITFRNLTIVPLIGGSEHHADYAILDEAIARGWVAVTEVTEAGRVPELRVVNHGDLAVLLLDGEELLGAKQNRVLNLTILVPPQASQTIPVSCVESGRWRRTSTRFSSAPRAQFAEGRAEKMRQVSASLAARGDRSSDQGAVWNLIAEKAARLAASSDTSAMAAMYDKVGHSLEDFVTAFSPVEGQVGAMFVVDDRVAGLELFDSPDTWRKLSSKLVRSYALDAIDRQRARARVAAPSVAAAIEAVISSGASVFPAVGEGEDVRLRSDDVVGAALVARGRAIHVSAFFGQLQG